jgi:uncharacterized repeat protein (TIGR01451 family)
VASGETLTYHLSVTNQGPYRADDATVSVATTSHSFSGPLVILSYTVTGSDGFKSSGTGNVQFTDDEVTIHPSQSIDYTIEIVTNSSTTGTLALDANVAPDFGDPYAPNDHQASLSTNLAPPADLSVTINDDASAVQAGGSVAYTITVRNNGPNDVRGAHVLDYLPIGIAGRRFNNDIPRIDAPLTAAVFTATATGAAQGFYGEDGSFYDDGQIDQYVDLPAGASITYTVIAALNEGASGTLMNTVMVVPPLDVPDLDTTNDTASISTPIIARPSPQLPQADLEITQYHHEPTETGVPSTYTIVIANNGPNDLFDVAFTDMPPVSFSGGAGIVSTTGGASGRVFTPYDDYPVEPITGHLNLPAGSTMTLVVQGVQYGPDSEVPVNIATVAAPSDAWDPNVSNNWSVDITPVRV